MERFYVQGEEMYYRRNNKRAKWHSLATPLWETQLIYFLVHQGNFVTVATCRIVATKDVDEQISVKAKEARGRR